MSKLILAASTIAALAVLAPAVQAAPEHPVRFLVENHNGQAIDSIAISRPTASSWRNATLPNGPVASGSASTVKVDPPEGGCQYDVRAQFHGGVTSEVDGVNLCQGKALVFD
jgi:hypothetical protein